MTTSFYLAPFPATFYNRYDLVKKKTVSQGCMGAAGKKLKLGP